MFKQKEPLDLYLKDAQLIDDATWVKKVIQSCENLQQLYVAQNLINVLKEKYLDKISSLLLESIVFNLYRMADTKDSELVYDSYK